MSRDLALSRRAAPPPVVNGLQAIAEAQVAQTAQIAEMASAIVDLVELLERNAQGAAPAASTAQSPAPVSNPAVVEAASRSTRTAQVPTAAALGATWTAELDTARGVMEIRRSDQTGGAVWHVESDRSTPGKLRMSIRRAQ